MGIDQRSHWDSVFKGNMFKFGNGPSAFGTECSKLLSDAGAVRVLELGSGQGRDTYALIEAGMDVVCIDYSHEACLQLEERFGERVTVIEADLREGIDLPEACADACYSHMLLTMDFTDAELKRMMSDLYRIIRPGGALFFSVRNVDDVMFGKGENLHGDVWENDGFAVHFFRRETIDDIASGFKVESVECFTENGKSLYGVRLRR